ncbi:MAG: hypothetical protein ACPGK1_16520, partial [bacterium]
ICFSCGDLTTKIHATCDALTIQRVFISALVKPMTYRGADVLLETILDQIAAPDGRHCLR